MSRLSPTGIKDQMEYCLRMAKRPTHLFAYLHQSEKQPVILRHLNDLQTLSQLLLVKEMFKQRQKSLEFEIGASIPPESYLMRI